MRAFYRILSILLTLVSAGLFGIVIAAVTSGDKLKVLGVVLFVAGGAVALLVALVLWARALSPPSQRKEPPA